MQRRLKCCRGGYTVWFNILSSGNAALWEMFREIQVLMLDRSVWIFKGSLKRLRRVVLLLSLFL